MIDREKFLTYLQGLSELQLITAINTVKRDLYVFNNIPSDEEKMEIITEFFHEYLV